MDLEKAYNKIDNFCCSNHNTLQGNTVRYLNGREEIIDMFSDYKENRDDDFCKDVYEMTDALETIKKVVDSQKDLGCPLDVLAKAIIQNCFYDGSDYKETNIGFVNQEGDLGIVISVAEWEYGNTMYLKDYKKTWWLRDDRSE